MKLHKDHLYRHFKGDTYIIRQLGEHTETGKRMVVYQKWVAQRPTGPVWIRPLFMFGEEMREGVPRFTHIGYAYPTPESPDEW